MKRELFIIGSDAWEALSPDEITHTVTDLKELGIYKLPYETVDIGVNYDAVTRCVNKDGSPRNDHEFKDGKAIHPGKLKSALIIFKDISLGAPEFASCVLIAGRPSFQLKPNEITWNKSDLEAGRHGVLADALIVLLATRNAIKTRVEHKLASLGIGKNRYNYTTTISLPHEMEEDEEHKPMGSKAAHLRRGHIRRQHYGPRNELIKKVWIEPVFVNADRDFVNQREHYNLVM